MSILQLTLTGDTTSSSRFVSMFCGTTIALPEIRHIGLLVLICAKLRRSSGIAHLGDFSEAGAAFEKPCLHQLIRRLRCDLDAALGSEIGNRLVFHHGRSRYSLQINLHEITVTPCFRDLEYDLPKAVFQLLAQQISDRRSESLQVSSPLPSKAM